MENLTLTEAKQMAQAANAIDLATVQSCLRHCYDEADARRSTEMLRKNQPHLFRERTDRYRRAGAHSIMR